MITAQTLSAWIHHFALVIEEQKGYLTDLDAQIGDADHGVNMARGFQKVMSQMPRIESEGIGGVLKITGMTLISSVGGASGPLYGTFFLDAAKEAGTLLELTPLELCRVFEAGLAGIQRIGKAQAGEKTMVDVLLPGIAALRESLRKGKSLKEAVSEMTSAASKARDATISMLARKGRASYLGERSIGHMDPGAASAYMLLETFADAILVGTPDNRKNE